MHVNIEYVCSYINVRSVLESDGYHHLIPWWWRGRKRSM